jgi:hypothetical protein
LFNISIYLYISENNKHAPVTGMTTIPELLFAGNLAFSPFTDNGLETATDEVTKYCREWNLKCNLNKTKILLFEKVGKLKKDERWAVNDPKIEVADEINYLRATFESSGGWKRQKLKIIAKGNQTLIAIGRYPARTPDINLNIP